MSTKLGKAPSWAAIGITQLVLASASMIVLLPLIWLLCASLKRNEDFFTTLFLPPGSGFLGIAWERLTFDHFRSLASMGIWRAALLSFFLSSVTAVIATAAAAMGGFALARLQFRGRRLVERLVLAAIIIPPTLLLAPGYQLLFQLGLLDTLAGLILPAAAPAFGLYLFRQATLSSVPPQLLEAARLDGCGDIGVFFRVALPLVMPMVSAFLMITFLGTWNNFLTPQVVMQTPSNFPLAVKVAQLRGVYYQEYGLLMAGTLVSIVPLLLLFLLLQRDFINGLISGAIKG